MIAAARAAAPAGRAPAAAEALLAEHVRSFGALDDVRAPARERLQEELCGELTLLLLVALTGDHRVRPDLLAV